MADREKHRARVVDAFNRAGICGCTGPDHGAACRRVQDVFADLCATVEAETWRAAHGLLYERADHFAEQSKYGSPWRPMHDDERASAARKANEWYEAARQVKARGAARAGTETVCGTCGGDLMEAEEECAECGRRA